jgi:hypothetical protein
MKGKYILATTLLLALSGALVYFYAGTQVPSGQAPLERLTARNVSDIGNAFNEAKGDVRVLLLLSPT